MVSSSIHSHPWCIHTMVLLLLLGTWRSKASVGTFSFSTLPPYTLFIFMTLTSDYLKLNKCALHSKNMASIPLVLKKMTCFHVQPFISLEKVWLASYIWLKPWLLYFTLWSYIQKILIGSPDIWDFWFALTNTQEMVKLLTDVTALGTKISNWWFLTLYHFTSVPCIQPHNYSWIQLVSLFVPSRLWSRLVDILFDCKLCSIAGTVINMLTRMHYCTSFWQMRSCMLFTQI